MKKILVIVDMQNDFTVGALGNEQCKEVIPEVINLISSEEYDEICITRDTHTEDYLNTREGKNLPVIHCVEGTDGHKIVAEIEAVLENITNVQYFNKPTFGSTDLAEYLRQEYLDEESELCLDFAGVCTGICVISNVLLAKANCPEAEINVIEKACACVTPESHKAALDAMKMCHINIK